MTRLSVPLLLLALLFTACLEGESPPDSATDMGAGAQSHNILTDPPVDDQGYFPEELFEDFGGHAQVLRDLEEPSLWSLSGTGGERMLVCRLLYLPSFEPQVVVRVVIDTQALTGALFYKSCAYADWSEAGELLSDEVFRLSAEQCETILQLLVECDFWYLNSTTEIYGLDGASWVLEGVRGERYHAVERWSADSEIFPMGICLLSFSGREHVLY